MKGAAVFNYQLTRRLGGGGFGDVWEAEHALTGKKVAVKVLHAETEPSVLDALKREALVLHRLSETWEARHPREPAPFVHFIDVGEVEGRPAIVMELLVGREVRADMTGPWEVARALDLAVEALDALGFAHAQGVIHRDVKPENLFFVDGGRVKLLDFGIAKVQQTLSAKSSRIAGSARYLAPERFDEITTPACDVYAMGLVLWELLVGAPACASETITGALRFHTVAGVPDVRAARPDVPAPVAEAIARLCARDPADRPADGAVAAASLRALARPEGAPDGTRWIPNPPKVAAPRHEVAPAAPAPVAAPTPVPTAPPRRGGPSRGWLRGLLGLGVGLIGASLLLFAVVALAVVAAFGGFNALLDPYAGVSADEDSEPVGVFTVWVDVPKVPVAETMALSRFTVAVDDPGLVAAAASDSAWCADMVARAQPMLAVVTERTLETGNNGYAWDPDGRAPDEVMATQLRTWAAAWKAAYDQGCRPAGEDTGPTLLIAADASVRYPRLADVATMAFASGFEAVALIVRAPEIRGPVAPRDGGFVIAEQSETGGRIGDLLLPGDGDPSRTLETVRQATSGGKAVGLLASTRTTVGEYANVWSAIGAEAPVFLGPRVSTYLVAVDEQQGESPVPDPVRVLVAHRPSPTLEAAMRPPTAPE